jgi:hypothetical protein
MSSSHEATLAVGDGAVAIGGRVEWRIEPTMTAPHTAIPAIPAGSASFFTVFPVHAVSEWRFLVPDSPAVTSYG